MFVHISSHIFKVRTSFATTTVFVSAECIKHTQVTVSFVVSNCDAMSHFLADDDPTAKFSTLWIRRNCEMMIRHPKWPMMKETRNLRPCQYKIPKMRGLTQCFLTPGLALFECSALYRMFMQRVQG